jgi:hypothetical protein
VLSHLSCCTKLKLQAFLIAICVRCRYRCRCRCNSFEEVGGSSRERLEREKQPPERHGERRKLRRVSLARSTSSVATTTKKTHPSHYIYIHIRPVRLTRLDYLAGLSPVHQSTRRARSRRSVCLPGFQSSSGLTARGQGRGLSTGLHRYVCVSEPSLPVGRLLCLCSAVTKPAMDVPFPFPRAAAGRLRFNHHPWRKKIETDRNGDFPGASLAAEAANRIDWVQSKSRLGNVCLIENLYRQILLLCCV